MDRKQALLGEILMAKGLISEQNLNTALEEQKKSKIFLGTILLKRGYIKEKDLLKALSEQFNIPLFSLKNKYIDYGLAKKFSQSLLLEHRCIPISKDDWSITIGINNPLDAWACKKAEEETCGLKLKFVLLSEGDVEDAVCRYKEYLRGDINRLFK